MVLYEFKIVKYTLKPKYAPTKFSWFNVFDLIFICIILFKNVKCFNKIFYNFELYAIMVTLGNYSLKNI